MPLIFTPGQLSRRSNFYYQLAQLTSAGLGVIAALDQVRKSTGDRAYRRPITLMLENLSQGYTVSEAMRSTGTWMPAFDLALIQAGEQSGRIDACFRLLADYYRDRAALARQFLADVAYPVFLFHFAIFILPFASLFASGNWVRYLIQTLGVLIPIYCLLFLIGFAAQSRHGERWRGLMESWMHRIPVLGSARRCLALSRLASALEALLSAGVTIIQAWELAADACGSPALRRVVYSWRPNLDGGSTPAEMVSSSRRFPDLFAGQYNAGEISGSLEETLRRMSSYYHDEGSRKLRAFAQWTPRIVYLCVGLMIAYKIIHFYAGYFQDIQKAGQF